MWEIVIDEAVLEEATTDLRRAMVLQNARFASRADPIGGVRARVEGPLRITGLVVSVLGLLLSALLISVGFARTLSVALFVVFVIAALVFFFAKRLRRALIARTDRRLARMAARTVRTAWKAGQERRYALRGRELTASAGGTSRARDLSRVEYGLLGTRSVVLFATRKAFRVRVVFPATCPEEVGDALRNVGVEVETLDAGLLPSAPEARAW